MIRSAILVLTLAAAPLGAQPAARPAADTSRFSVDDALDVTTVGATDLTDDGRWLAAITASRRDALGADFSRDGDPTYVAPRRARVWVIDTQSGERRAVFPAPENAKSPVWSPDGRSLALLVVRGDRFEPVIWDRASGRLTRVAAAPGTYVAENSDVQWTRDGRSLVFSVRPLAWRDSARAEFARLTRGPVTVMSSTEPFLAWEGLRRRAIRRAVVAYDVAARRLRELVPEGAITSYTLTGDSTRIVVTEDQTRKTDYDVIFGADTRLVVRTPGATGADTTPRVLLASLRNTSLAWSEDGTRYAYARDGRVWVASVRDTAAARQVAGPAAAPAGRRDSTPADTSAAGRERAARERFSVVRFSPRGDALALSNKEGLWVLDLASGERKMFAATPDSTVAAPRLTVVAWSEDGAAIYLASASRVQWERGLLRYDRATGRTEELARDARYYTNVRLAKDGRTMVMSVAEGNRPADVYAADAMGKSVRRLTDANPQLRGRRFGKTQLVDYLDADGQKRYAVVYYPAEYAAGRRYPTVFNVYEEYFDDTFDATTNVLTANGYVVVRPSVGFDIGYPGEAWLKGVTAAANKLIELGVADSARLGVHGTSYGGYATNILVTQTRRFKAAINISGKVDAVSFYTDSPRLGVRNVHAAEKSQDRLGATLWQQPQKYVQHSAVMFADRIQTPLLLITGGEDHNVPAKNSSEMFYALRRLGKEVEWVNYVNGGHGTPSTNVEEFADYHTRILGWYDRLLKPKPAATPTAATTSP